MLGSEKKIYLEFPLFTSNSSLIFEWIYKWSLNYKIKNSDKCLSFQIILKETKNIWSIANLLIKGRLYMKPVWFDESLLMMRSRMFDSNLNLDQKMKSYRDFDCEDLFRISTFYFEFKFNFWVNIQMIIKLQDKEFK